MSHKKTLLSMARKASDKEALHRLLNPTLEDKWSLRLTASERRYVHSKLQAEGLEVDDARKESILWWMEKLGSLVQAVDHAIKQELEWKAMQKK